MKSLASKLFFATSVLMLGTTISCKEKPAENNTDAVDTSTVVEPTAPSTPDTTTVPVDTTKTPKP